MEKQTLNEINNHSTRNSNNAKIHYSFNNNCVFPIIENIVILTFDNEVGQIVENEYPRDGLEKQLLKVICIKGFPETNKISQNGDLGYIFKVRTNSKFPLKCHNVSEYSFLYCYTLFLQVKNKNMKRGYTQKSIIITSKYLAKSVIFRLLENFKELILNKEDISYSYLNKLYISFNKGIEFTSNKDLSDYLENNLNNIDLFYSNEDDNNKDKTDNKGTLDDDSKEKKQEIIIEEIKGNAENKDFTIKNLKMQEEHINNIAIKDKGIEEKNIINNSSNNETEHTEPNKIDSKIKLTNFKSPDTIISTGYNSDTNTNTKSLPILNSLEKIDSGFLDKKNRNKSLEIKDNQQNSSVQSLPINNNNNVKFPMNYNFYKSEDNWKDCLSKSYTEFQFNNFFEVFSLFYVAKLWQIWELIILEYPILVFADDSSRVSNIVFLLESITHPLQLQSDIRPYFSIYDPDFKEYKEDPELRQHNSAILGVINPIFMKLISDWPVVLRFDEYFFNNDLKTKLPESPLFDPISNTITSYYDTKIKKSSTLYEVKKYMKKSRNFALKGNSQLIFLFLECLKSQGNACYEKLNFHLRAHFSELTRDFIKTIDDFVLLNEIREIKRITLSKQHFSIFEIFNKDKFIKYLKDKSDNIAFNYKYIHDKKKTVSLYTEFLNTKCFRNHMNFLLKQLKNEI